LEVDVSRQPSVPRAEVLRRMRRTFRESGFDGTTMATLSASTGLAKAALYHYFPGGKEEMGAAVLDDVGEWTVERVLAPLREAGPPRERVRAVADALDELYAGGGEACLVGLFSTGQALDAYRTRLRGSLEALVAALRDVAEEAGVPADVAAVRAEDVVVRIQGSLVVSRVLGDTGPFRRFLARLPDELLGP
jgi:TetR/AcrR family transcriptional regulator, lmrAB and yxaGH operons repressor